jgi:hypothetical protein
MINVRIIKQVADNEPTFFLLEGVNKLNGRFLIAMGGKWLPGYKCRGVWELPESLALEMAGRGIRIIENILHPAF